MSTNQSYAGRGRRKTTRLSVRIADVIAQRLIAVGGIGTIVAVSMVFVFLFFVVAPLFTNASMSNSTTREVTWMEGDPIKVKVDEYRTMGWVLYADGKLNVFRLDTGEVIETKRLFEGKKLTAWSFPVANNSLALGFDDGTIRFGKISFDVAFQDKKDVSESVRALDVDGVTVVNNRVLQKTSQDQYRSQAVVDQFQDDVKVCGGAVALLDYVPPEDDGSPTSDGDYLFSFLGDDDQFQVCVLSSEENILTGEVTFSNRAYDIPKGVVWRGTPFRLLMSGRGDNVLVVWANGDVVRYDVRQKSEAQMVEHINVIPARDAELTLCEFIIGRDTMIFGDDRGRVNAWFRVRTDDEPGGEPSSAGWNAESSVRGLPADGFRMVRTHQLEAGTSAVRSMGFSERSRMLVAGFDDGSIRICHVTTEHTVLSGRPFHGSPVDHVLIAPKDNGLVAMSGSRVWTSAFEAAYPEATVHSLFGAVWYEGYSEPKHIWQSSFATSAPEMKLGLWPLIFGTIKATFYTMLIGAPLALLAAIYTSEFLSGGMRAKIKPTVEMMASLPSVVLGFLAAMIFAPLVETFVPSALAGFVTLPAAFLLGAYLWQMQPRRQMLIMARYRFFFMIIALLPGLLSALWIGPWVEQMLFSGDIKRWLDGQIGTGTGAWMLLLLPICAVGTAFVVMFNINTWLRSLAHGMSRQRFAFVNLLKFGGATLCCLIFAYGLSWTLAAAGFDPRGSFVDTYEQRNALVVGFVMGFAVIPIIYTIADDALSTVPQHLRSASLGAGATPWQTTVRIVIPTAMSGLFSALMIGLGRAVGETMIVLMAGGNTPVFSANVFNGFRTLAANIAVELPEAVKDSTHYRTLFLAALSLFVLTFVINTLAEIVRLRFRRRAYQL